MAVPLYFSVGFWAITYCHRTCDCFGKKILRWDEKIYTSVDLQFSVTNTNAFLAIYKLTTLDWLSMHAFPLLALTNLRNDTAALLSHHWLKIRTLWFFFLIPPFKILVKGLEKFFSAITRIPAEYLRLLYTPYLMFWLTAQCFIIL